LLIPFFGWAVHLLRRRFVYYEENTIGLEALTSAGLVVFFWVEATVLKYALGQQILLYGFAVLGLVVAGFALYAHVVISLASRILVDLVAPAEGGGVDHPRFGPVESLERSEDYEGALQEYLVLARIYPRNFEVLTRAARVNEILGRSEEAVAWYMRARKRATDAREALTAVNRLCALYDGELDRPDESDAQLAWFLESYPKSLDFSIVRDRLERRAIRADGAISTQLAALDANPMEEASPPDVEVDVPPTLPPIRATGDTLVPLEAENPNRDDQAIQTEEPLPAKTAARVQGVALERMAEVPEIKEKRTDSPAPRRNGHAPTDSARTKGVGGRSPKSEPSKVKRSSMLQPLTEVEASRPVTESPKPTSKPKISLESMDGDSETA